MEDKLLSLLKGIEEFRNVIDNTWFKEFSAGLPHWKDLPGYLELREDVEEGRYKLHLENPYAVALHPKTFHELRAKAVETGVLIPFPTGEELAVLITSMERLRRML